MTAIESYFQFHIDEEPEPKQNPRLQNSDRTPTQFLKYILRTRKEPNPYHQRTRTEHESKILGSFPSLIERPCK